MFKDLILELGKKIKLGESTWKEQAEIFNEQTGLDISGEALRKRYSSIAIDEPIKQESNGKEFTTIYGNGTVEAQKIVNLSPEQKKDQREMLKAVGYNPDEWELVQLSFSNWQTHTKEQTTKELYAVKFRIKPKTAELSVEEAYKAMENVFKDTKPLNIPNKKINKELDEDKLLVLTAIEAHLGKLADDIIGAKYDHHIVKERVMKVIEETVQFQRQEKCDSCLVIVGGDFFNSESNSQTTGGTPQINDTRPNKMFEIGCDLYKLIILTLRQEFNHIEVKLNAGNHARNMEGMLYTALKMKFENDSVVNFYNDNPNTSAYKWGKTAIYLNHGDTNEKRLLPSMSAQFPEIWGTTTYRYLLSQHLHKRLALDNENGITFIRTPAICENDEWHETNRFGIGITPQQQIIVFHKHKPLVTDHFISFEESKKKTLTRKSKVSNKQPLKGE